MENEKIRRTAVENKSTEWDKDMKYAENAPQEKQWWRSVTIIVTVIFKFTIQNVFFNTYINF